MTKDRQVNIGTKMKTRKDSAKRELHRNQKREEKLLRKKDVNKTPSNPYEQECPRKLSELKINQCQKKTKKRKTGAKQLLCTTDFIEKDVGSYPAKGRPLKPIPVVEQLPDESPFSFFKRVSAATRMVIGDTKFETQYRVDLQRSMTGDVVGVQPWEDAKASGAKERKRIKQRAYNLKRKEKKKRKKHKSKHSGNSVEDSS